MTIIVDGKSYLEPDNWLACRFLNHATLGYSESDVNALMSLPNGYWQWLEAQFTVQDTPLSTSYYPANDPSVDHYTWVSTVYGIEEGGTLANIGFGDFDLSYSPVPFVSSVVRKAMHTQETLRLKTAYALSQILVVSGTNGLDDVLVYLKVAGYFDILTQHAFKSYEELLWAISKNIVMGEFLTFIGSEKEAPPSRQPDENYAREFMQLFTIGPDALDATTGLPVLKAMVDGKPVFHESYGSAQVGAAAKVFTGWKIDTTTARFVSQPWERFRGVTTVTRGAVPRTIVGNEGLVNDAALHDGSAVTLSFPLYSASTGALSSTSPYTFTVSASLSAEDRMKQFVSQMVRHPNTAFHVSRQLIQRFTTSNPSPAYVARVAAKFRTEVGGKVGDMKSVLKAILLDEELFRINPVYNLYERSVGPGVADFGKLREPFSRLTGWARAFQALPSYKYGLSRDTNAIFTTQKLGQAPLCAPSVFNFYRPGYVAPQGRFCAQTRTATTASTSYTTNLVAPEMQITNGASLLAYADFISKAIDFDQGVGGLGQIKSDYTSWIGAAVGTGTQLDPLLDRLGYVLCAGVFSGATREAVRNTLDAMPDGTATQRRLRVQMAVFLIMISPDYLVQQ